MDPTKRPEQPHASASSDTWRNYYRHLDGWITRFEHEVKKLQARRPVMLDIPPDKEMPDRAIYAEGENYEGFDSDVVYWHEGLENLLEGIVPSTRLADAQAEWDSTNWTTDD